MRRTAVLIATLAMVAAACGDSGGTTTQPGTDPPATTVTTSAAIDTTTTTTGDLVTTTTGPGTSTTSPATTTTTTAPRTASWVRLDANDGPANRRNAVLVVASGEGVAYLHGGRSDDGSHSDLWQLDLTNGTWTPLSPGGEGPEPRFSHTGVWDEARRRLVIFSGEGEGFGDFFSDVWTFDPAVGEWELLAPDDAGPSNRYGSCVGYDRAGDRFLISHGFTDDGRFDDTWAFSLADNTWADITPDGERPGERCLHTCAWDDAGGRFVLFGGQDNDLPFLGDTWVLADGAWTEVAAPGPSPRKFPAAVATRTHGVVLTGGIGADGPTDDAWSFQAGSWKGLDPDGRPPARESHAAAHDPDTGLVYVFGGRGTEGDLADVWVFDPGS